MSKKSNKVIKVVDYNEQATEPLTSSAIPLTLGVVSCV